MKTRGGGKAKGGDWERYCCKKLSLWLSGGKHDDWFWRSAMSGGRASVQFKQGSINRTQQGDLTAIDPRAYWFTDIYTIECKHVSDLGLLSLLARRSPDCPIAIFWRDLLKVCERTSRHPFMIAKQNRLPALVIVRAPLKTPLERKALRFTCGNIMFYDFEAVLKGPPGPEIGRPHLSSDFEDDEL